MEDIKKQAELYAESFRYKIDDAGWYEQKVRDFIAGYEAALRIHDVSGRSKKYCQCVSRTGVNGEQYGKWTCKSCGKEVVNKHRQY